MPTAGPTTDRRAALQTLIGAAAGLTGCTPLRIVLRTYPETFDQDPARLQRVLVAFVDAVVPGAVHGNTNPERALNDPYYGLAKYRSFLACELTSISVDRFQNDRFETLARPERTSVISGALAKGGIVARLLRAAIHLTQISCYSGMYDPDGGCALIGFEGRRGVRGPAAASYPVSEQFTPRSITTDGNPV